MKRGLYFIVVSVLLITSACKKQPLMTEFNQNCSGNTMVSAQFTMEELASQIGSINEDKRTNTDTIYHESNVYFNALEDNAEYTWYVGQEIIHERSFYRYFDASLIGQSLPITLVVKKTPNNICFPEDDGYDSIVKYLTVVEDLPGFYFLDNHLFEGTFRVKDQNSTDSIDIEIYIKHAGEDNYFFNRIDFYNLEGNNELKRGLDVGLRTYRQRWFNMNPLPYGGRIYRRMDGVLELQIQRSDDDIVYLFKGRKL